MNALVWLVINVVFIVLTIESYTILYIQCILYTIVELCIYNVRSSHLV